MKKGGQDVKGHNNTQLNEYTYPLTKLTHMLCDNSNLKREVRR